MTTVIACSSESTSRAKKGENPLLMESWGTPYEIPPFERITPDHYLEAFEVALEEQLSDIERIVGDESELGFGSVIFSLDNSGLRLRELRDLFEMSEAAISDESYRRVSENIWPRLAAAEDAIWMNEALFSKVKRVYAKRADLGLDDLQMRLTEKIYNHFVRGGAELTAADKKRLAAINEELATLTSKFSRNLLAENDAYFLNLKASQLEGLSQTFRAAARKEAERRGIKNGWAVSLNPSMMLPFLSTSKERELRKDIYTAYLNRGANGGENDNPDVVRRVSELRQQRAAMLGYENHAEYVISEQMAGSAEAAYRLLDALYEPALERAKLERDILQGQFEKDFPDEQIQSWDWRYYAEAMRAEKYKLAADATSQYFPAEGVRSGAFLLANRLYGITFRPIVAPIYDDDCVAFEVLDTDNTSLGVLYFDLYPRSGKGQGAWCGNLREQRTDGGERILPIVAIVCNFPRPSGSTPSLLSLEQVETLFHEFGHALHFLFQNVDYHGLAAVEGDFVELPSQVMENWALDPEFLPLYAVHYRTGAQITPTIIENIKKSRHFNQGYETLSLVSAALLDLDLHTTTDLSNFDVESFERESLYDKRAMIEEVGPRYHLTNFAHLFTYDYSAGYYFYLWAEVLDKDCFSAFKSSGDLYSRDLATKLRRELLERGGEADGMTLYRNFRGSDPQPEALIEAKGLSEEHLDELRMELGVK
ncbi:MAG: M3 family metallopeptidase [Rikenellaceae bacterium]